MTDGERLKKLRKALGIKQGDFAKRISTTQGHISDIENGRKNLSDRTIKLICLENWDGKRVCAEWLRTGEGGDEYMFKKELLEDEYMTYITEIGNGASDAIKKAIIKYGRLSPENKKIIDEAIELLVKMAKEE